MWCSVHSWKDQSQRITSFMCGWLAVRMKRLSKSNFEENPLGSILLFYFASVNKSPWKWWHQCQTLEDQQIFFYQCAAWLPRALKALMFAEARNRNGLRLISPEREGKISPEREGKISPERGRASQGLRTHRSSLRPCKSARAPPRHNLKYAD